MKRIIYLLLGALVVFTACNGYDDSALQEKLSDLEERVKANETAIQNLKTSLDNAINNALTVSLTTGTDGETLVFSNGVSVDVPEGVEISETDSSYIIEIGDVTYEIEKTATFLLKVAQTEYSVIPNEKVEIAYTLTGASENTKMRAETEGGFKVKIDAEKSVAVVTTPNVISNGAYLVLTAYDNETGLSSSQYISFTAGEVVYTGEQMLLIPGGTFTVGENAVHTDAGSNTWQCTLPDYYIAATEVTQVLWAEIMGTEYLSNMLSDGQKPEGYICYPVAKADYQPQPYINWKDAVIFCNRLSIKRGADPCYSIDGDVNPDNWPEAGEWEKLVECDWSKNGFRLPALPEWEWAAGGAKTPLNTFPGTDSFDDLKNYGWIQGTFEVEGFHDVATKNPTALGLYDMAGNATEWVWELWFEYPGGSRTYYKDVITWDYGQRQAIKRGGTIWNWGNQVYYTTSNWRDPIDDHNWPCGMRLARTYTE